MDQASLRCFGEVYKIISFHLIARGASHSQKIRRIHNTCKVKSASAKSYEEEGGAGAKKGVEGPRANILVFFSLSLFALL